MIFVAPNSDLEHELANLEDDSVSEVSTSDIPPSHVREVQLKKLNHKLLQVELLVKVFLIYKRTFLPIVANLEPS